MSVLIVDDDPIFCRFLAETLEAKEMDAEWTTDGLKGFELSLDRDFDLFIIDVRMPLIFGTELAEEIRADNPKAKIILISAFADDALKQFSKKLNVSMLSKPFAPERLLQEVEKTLGVTL